MESIEIIKKLLKEKKMVFQKFYKDLLVEEEMWRLKPHNL
jgi:hypothetical protein